MSPEDVQKASYKIVLKIYEITITEKDKVWFGKLVDIFEGTIEKSTISRSIDYLEDICMIESAYQNIDGKAARCMTIDDDYMPCIEAMYNDSIKRV